MHNLEQVINSNEGLNEAIEKNNTIEMLRNKLQKAKLKSTRKTEQMNILIKNNKKLKTDNKSFKKKITSLLKMQ